VFASPGAWLRAARSAQNAARVLAGWRGVDAQVEKLAAFMGAHYREEIGVEEIARAANLNANYAMTLFRQKCGLGLWEYVLRRRVSNAQHLLLPSERKMDHIARASGSLFIAKESALRVLAVRFLVSEFVIMV
jgi:transcriptional regulator GlxA family with amidase domain